MQRRHGYIENPEDRTRLERKGAIDVEHFALILGKIVLYAGGSLLGVLFLGVVAVAAGELWIEASRRWRGIVKAESLILEYKRCREDFKEWYKEKEGS